MLSECFVSHENQKGAKNQTSIVEKKSNSAEQILKDDHLVSLDFCKNTNVLV